MRYIRQVSPGDNALAALCNLIYCLKIKVTASYLKGIKYHKDYPSLLALVDYLEDLSVDSLAVKLDSHQLSEIPYPAIAHLHKNNGHFVVLQKCDNGYIQYLDPEIGTVNEKVDEFKKKWTGITLLVQVTEKSGEENYSKKRKIEIVRTLNGYLSVSLFIISLVFSLMLISSVYIPIFILKAIGLVFCLILLQKQFGSMNSYLSSFCKLGSKSDCDAVINSTASKFFGLLHLSELGVLYFLGNIILIVHSGFIGVQIDGALVVLNLFVLPFTLFSVYYQKIVIKKWCPLCIIVMGVFWIEFYLLWQPLSKLTVSATGLYLALLIFSLLLAIWLSVRERFISSYKVPALERSLSRFSKSGKIFSAVLDQETEVNIGEFTNEIKAGAVNPQVELTVVSNLMCGPCSYAHRIIEELLKRYSEKLSVRFRFTINGVDKDSDSARALRHIAALSLTNENGRVVKSLSAWFSQTGRRSLSMWKEDHPIETVNENEVDLVLSEHHGWCKQVNIQATPTIFINGKKLPADYTVDDLKYHMRNLVNN